ncbi:glycosyl hydrolase [Teredinibacter turnerae]|uniref:glycosyl hydrolase n=1 Tax=Teredinibacter turnerae TaxID=2426 RepID=UPI00037CB0DB|nr:glycosyl hydrolase [Teredinibacter turnerae]
MFTGFYWRMLAIGSLLVIAAVGLNGCGGSVEQSAIDNSDQSYQVEERPLGIIAGESLEIPLGESATLSGRIVGYPRDGLSVRWVQTSGPEVTLMDDTSWNSNTITFTTPATTDDGVLTYRFEIQGVDADGVVATDADGNDLRATASVVAFDPARALTFEAEDQEVATLTGGASLVHPGDDQFISGASGDAMTADLTPGQGVDFRFVIAPENAGFYALTLRYGIGLGYGGKNAIITVNAVPTEVVLSVEGQIAELKVGTFKFAAGEHHIRIADGWNYYRLDSLLLFPAAAPPVPLAVPPAPINAQASQAAIDLKTYLTEAYTKGILSGQQSAIYDGSNALEEHAYIEAEAGKTPAIYAFDYMDYSASRAARGTLNTGLTEAALQVRESGAILSASWHWNAPFDLLDTEEQPWYKGFYSAATDFDLTKALTDDSSAERAALMADLHIIADELTTLRDAGVPLLWRPLHEAEGEWFWWGAHGPENFKALWHLMYAYFTQERELNNLLWVYSATGALSSEWYPGDAYVDIVGFDGYDGSANGEDAIFKSQWDTLLARFNGKKLIALTETGYVPDVEAMAAGDVWWSYFSTWSSGDGWGPQFSHHTAARYNAAITVNAGDLPAKISGGVGPTTPGVFASFDDAAVFNAQVNWSDSATAGVAVQSQWVGGGFRALRANLDLPAAGQALGETPTSVIVQTWEPQNGEGMQALELFANAQNAGDSVTAKLWAKDASGSWKDTGAQAIANGGVSLVLDLTGSEFDFSSITSFGVQFENFDAASTAAEFFIDEIVLRDAAGDEKAITRFEQNAGFVGQLDWREQAGYGISNRWAAEGAQSLGFIFSPAQKTDWGDYPSAVLQRYPEGGVDVSSVQTLSIAVHTGTGGDGVTGKLWVKDAAGNWLDSGAVNVGDAHVLSIDISSIDTLSGFGVQFENFSLSAPTVEVFIDKVSLDDSNYESFEELGEWEAQADWQPIAAAEIQENTGEQSTRALVLRMDASQKTDWVENPSVVLQTYPQINVRDIAELQVWVSSRGAGTGVTAKLFVKHGENWTWVNAEPVVIPPGGATLMLDVSNYSVIAGWGVQFEAFDTSATQAEFVIDSVVFTATEESE